MQLMLCPPSLRFHGSSIALFDWNCIENKYVFASGQFECPVSRLLYDKGEVEYWMYEPVDLTVQSATNSATGSTMQGETFLLFVSVSFNYHH